MNPNDPFSSCNEMLAALEPPDYLQVDEEDDDDGIVTLSWPSVEGASGYRIYRQLAVST